jgi:hypothetical protein
MKHHEKCIHYGSILLADGTECPCDCHKKYMNKETKIYEIVIEGIVYVPKSQVQEAEKLEGMPYVMVRTYSAGVFAGYLKSKEYTASGTIVVLAKARRIWYWDGAASLSQLATEGTSKPENCKFPCEVESVELNAIEIILITEKARKTIAGVSIWKM